MVVRSVTSNSWRLVDRLVATYGVLISLLALTRLGRPGMLYVLGIHLILPGLAWLATRASTTLSGRFLRAAYPILILSGLYSAIDILNGAGSAHTWDHQLQSIEFAIFGSQPSRDWWRAHPSTLWSTIFHGAYLSYYAVIGIPVFVLLAKRRDAALDRYVDGVIATYLFCYLCYIFFPVAGPYYEFARPTGAFIANLPARMVYKALAGGSAFGAAFPSSHVAATVAATIGAWRGSRKLGMILAVPTALIAIGVVYCQMHYAVDSAAGIVVGIGVSWVATREQRTENREPRGGFPLG